MFKDTGAGSATNDTISSTDALIVTGSTFINSFDTVKVQLPSCKLDTKSPTSVS